jgi:eukaryotic-like serine/threonine-protein kinase
MTGISADEWRSLSEHLDLALDLDESARTAWVGVLAKQDPALADRVARALAARERVGFAEFLAGPSPLPIEDTGAATLIGRAVGPYVIEAEIGRGGMGSVWRARRTDGRYEGTVAIKFVHAAWIGRAGEQRFRIEGKLLGRLDHPHIARLLDAGVLEGSQPYLILEYVEGEPIDAYCERHRLSVEGRVGLFLDVLAAAAHAHSHLIVHRDIKPANIFVTRDGVVKLLDFGIAKLLDDDPGSSALTRSSAAALTPQYAAPEQLLGQPVSTATDVYALGLVLYVLLTGSHPIPTDSRSNAQLINAVVTEVPPHASAVARVATIPGRALEGDLDNILHKALKKEPRERYASVDALADDLRRYLTDQPVQARPDTLGYRTQKFVRRHRGGVAATSLAFIASLAGVTATLLQGREARVQRDFAYAQLSRAENVTDFNAFVLSDAAPMGRPFTVNDLLRRAEHIVDRQQGPIDSNQVELLIALGRQFETQEQHSDSRRILEKAYQRSQALIEPSTRAKAACALAEAISNSDAPLSATRLIEEGLAQIPKKPQFALDRVFCLCRASEVQRNAGDFAVALILVQRALQELRASPFDSDAMEMHVRMDVAESLSQLGRTQDAIREFAQVSALATKLGRDETQTAGTIYNNWGLALSSVGQSLEAERLFRRAIEVNRAAGSDQAESPTLLTNYARTLNALARFDEAADTAQKALNIAERDGADQVIDQSMVVLSQIFVDQQQFARAQVIIDELEPRLQRHLAPGHYAFAALLATRAIAAAGLGDGQTAITLADKAVAMGEDSRRSGKANAAILARLYLKRAKVQLSGNRAAAAVIDANRCVTLLVSQLEPGTASSILGEAYLTLAQAKKTTGDLEAARQAAATATDQFSRSVGPDNPRTRAALDLQLAMSTQDRAAPRKK